MEKRPEDAVTNLGLPTKPAPPGAGAWRGFADFLPWVSVMSCLNLWDKGSPVGYLFELFMMMGCAFLNFGRLALVWFGCQRR